MEPFTAEELKVSATQADLDGYLIDYAAKGARVELAGMEKVEDHDHYKVKVTTKEVFRAWFGLMRNFSRNRRFKARPGAWMAWIVR